MIPFSFAYLAPDTLAEAVLAYTACTENGQNPLYYVGGTEIITKARVNSIRFGAVIDLKHIPEMSGLCEEESRFMIGAAQTLNDIACWNQIPLLTKCCQRVADHTAQCKITLGGNIAGTVIYHEAVLALILAQATAVLFGPEGRRETALSALFTPKLSLKPGEFLVRFMLDKRYAAMDYIHVKHVESEKIGYPLFTLAAIADGNRIRAAVSGLYAHPVWADFALDDCAPETGKLADAFKKQADEEVISDFMASGEYRLFRLEQALCDMLKKLGGGAK